MVSYVHTVYVTCYFCYMFSLGTSSGNTGSVRIYTSTCERYTEDNVQTGGVVRVRLYVHTVYVTCYFCYMFSLGTSSGSTGSVRIYTSTSERYTPNIYRCIPT
jgi:hypothetical protein